MESNEKALSDGEEAAEEERILSLMAMLHDMVRRKGRIEAPGRWASTPGRWGRREAASKAARLEKHGLTLPPEKTPLRGSWRRSQFNWRKATLREVRRAVAWRHLPWKALTCGLWQSRWWRGCA